MLWTEDFGPEKGMEKTAYFVYGGFFIAHLWGERFGQSPKGAFLEVPYNRVRFTAEGNPRPTVSWVTLVGRGLFLPFLSLRGMLFW